MMGNQNVSQTYSNKFIGDLRATANPAKTFQYASNTLFQVESAEMDTTDFTMFG